MGDKINVRLFAALRKRYQVGEHIGLSTPRVVKSIIDEIGIPECKVTVMFIDGKHAGLLDTVHPGQTLSLFPPTGGG